MYNLLYCCVSLWEKEFYRTMNICDIIVTAFFAWNTFGNKGYSVYHFEPKAEGFVDFAFLIVAIVSLVVHFIKNSFDTFVHKIYMVFRYFLDFYF